MPRSCSSCGAQVSADGRFCDSCGASLWTTCPACGGEQAAEAAVCSSCGGATLEGAHCLVARLDGRLDAANGLILEGADELDRLGRHYDAACAALEAATAAEASGHAEIESAARSRAAALLDPLGCVNPF